MEKPGKKLKKFFIIIGTTGMVYAGLKYLLPLVVPLLLGYTTGSAASAVSTFFAAPDHNMRIWKKMETITGIAGNGSAADPGSAWQFYVDYGSPPSLGRDFYPDGPAAGMAGRAVFLDRGKMLWA